MTETINRLWQILRVVEKEDIYLQGVIQRLFPRQDVISPVWLENLLATPEGIDRLESFVGKFSRMQDTLVDKLLPHFLLAVGEEPGTALDNLDRAECLGPINSADEWMTMRNIRNQMVHEYIEDPIVLTSALQSGHAFVPALIAAAGKMITEIERRGLA